MQERWKHFTYPYISQLFDVSTAQADEMLLDEDQNELIKTMSRLSNMYTKFIYRSIQLIMRILIEWRI